MVHWSKLSASSNPNKTPGKQCDPPPSLFLGLPVPQCPHQRPAVIVKANDTRNHHLASSTKCILSIPSVPLTDLDQRLGQNILPYLTSSFPIGSHMMLDRKGEVTEYKVVCSNKFQVPHVISLDPSHVEDNSESPMKGSCSHPPYQALWHAIIPGHAAPDQGGVPADGSRCYLGPGKTVIGQSPWLSFSLRAMNRRFPIPPVPCWSTVMPQTLSTTLVVLFQSAKLMHV